MRAFRRASFTPTGAIILVTLCAARSAHGQLEGPLPANEARAGEAPRAALDDPDVYVNDSFEASDALAKANGALRKVLERAANSFDQDEILYMVQGVDRTVKRNPK